MCVYKGFGITTINIVLFIFFSSSYTSRPKILPSVKSSTVKGVEHFQLIVVDVLQIRDSQGNLLRDAKL